MRDLHELVAGDQVPLQVRSAQVEVAVFEARVLLDVRILKDLERRRFGLREHAQLGYLDLDFARRDLHVLRCALPHLAARRKHELAADGERLLEDIPVGALVKGELHNAGAVTQIDEDQLPEVTLPLYPAAHDYLLAHVIHPQRSAIVRPLHPIHCLSHDLTASFLNIL